MKVFLLYQTFIDDFDDDLIKEYEQNQDDYSDQDNEDDEILKYSILSNYFKIC